VQAGKHQTSAVTCGRAGAAVLLGKVTIARLEDVDRQHRRAVRRVALGVRQRCTAAATNPQRTSAYRRRAAPAVGCMGRAAQPAGCGLVPTWSCRRLEGRDPPSADQAVRVRRGRGRVGRGRVGHRCRVRCSSGRAGDRVPVGQSLDRAVLRRSNRPGAGRDGRVARLLSGTSRHPPDRLLPVECGLCVADHDLLEPGSVDRW